MFARKSHSWFWYAFWSLTAAACIYLIARFFSSATDSIHNKKPAHGSSDKASDKDALFI